MGLADTYMDKVYDHDLATVLDDAGEPWTGYMQYRMAAKNRWGPGPFCWPHLEIVDARAPERTNTPDSTIDPIDGDLKIEWETPNGNGLVVTSYQVEVMNSNGNWEYTEECLISTNPRVPSTIYQSSYGAGDHLFCKIKMETLTSATGYNLAFDEPILVRVRAQSYGGFGGWSAVSSDGQRTRQIPGPVVGLVDQSTSTDPNHPLRQFKFI
jgi:hypothetical protein